MQSAKSTIHVPLTRSFVIVILAGVTVEKWAVQTQTKSDISCWFAHLPCVG